MYVTTKSFRGDKPFVVGTPAWHTKIVVKLMCGAMGDLMLDRYGNLATRETHDHDTRLPLPFNQHNVGETLALIGQEGWMLTAYGAQWILENLPPDSRADLAKLNTISKSLTE